MFNYSTELKEILVNALRMKGSDYVPRTRHLDDQSQPLYVNRLILEDSPYLLQHAHNPVDWHPWGDEAFDLARRENKPVFLSIGYSTCHWCHVMEEESFDDETVAGQMNAQFICIKVDRELHPEVDTFYMTAVMMMRGQGGWPMSSFLTADRKPFFGGTYFKPTQFTALMNRVNEVWHQQASDIKEQAEAISQQVADAMIGRHSLNEIGTNVIATAAQSIMNHHDLRFGGFGQAPKFPNEPYLYFLLEYVAYSGNADILNAIVNTLHIQSCGGIYDQLAGGFHRYATDHNWLIPHFEKMLYNQANLSSVFTKAFVLTESKDFKRVATETLDYVLREMTDASGGFYSATDADSEGEEGLFFIWDKQEIESLLDEADAKLFISLYQVTDAGNFEGKNILNLARPLQQYAEENRLDYEDLIVRLSKCKKILWDERSKRIPPLRDDKIITAWNGMMIRAFAEAGQQLDRPDYIEAAVNAAEYLLQHNQIETGLSRASLNGQASIPALQEDYAYLAEALLAVYDATKDRQWVQQAESLIEQMQAQFWDNDDGGYFMGSTSGISVLPTMPKEIQDNATASGNSVALRALVRLARRSGKQQYLILAQQLVRAFSDDINQRPYICSYLMCGLLEMHIGEQQDSQWCAAGNVHIKAKKQRNADNVSVILFLSIKNKWHLNQIEDDRNNVVPVSIETNRQISNIIYPQAVAKNLDFQPESVKVYEGDIEIQFDVKQIDSAAINLPENILKLNLGILACDDQHCLAPEKVNLILSL